MIQKNEKLSDILIRNHNLIPVISRFNIPLGTGDKTISEICKETGIHTELFLIVLNSLDDKTFTVNEKINPFYILPIMEYLKKTHTDYLDIQINNIDRHIKRLISSSSPSDTNLNLLFSLFSECKKELSELIFQEENKTFPYILFLYELFFSPEYICSSDIENIGRIHKFGQEYTSVNQKLRDLENLMIKYLKGNYDENIFYGVILSLNRLKEDITETQRLEEIFLTPIVTEMGKEIRKRKG